MLLGELRVIWISACYCLCALVKKLQVIVFVHAMSYMANTPACCRQINKQK